MKILTIDIGGTYIKYALMNEDLSIDNKGKIKTPKEGRVELIETIGKIYDSMPTANGIGISMPGIIDSEKGYCYMGGALSYNNDFYIRDSLYERCKTKITVENDAKCAAMAEARVGSLSDVSDGLVLIFGTMIGGAYIKDKKLVRGKHFSAGEVSYIITERDSLPNCENVWGNYSGTPRLCKLYCEEIGMNIPNIDGVMVFEAVNNGDKLALNALDKYTRGIAVQIFNLQTVLDPEKIAIGGGISAQPIFLDYINKNLDLLYSASPYAVPKAQIVSCSFQNDANLIGALQCFLEAK